MNARRAGFTLIELMITLVVMVALMSLGVAAISNLQAQGRDKEREEDMAIIARGLEAYYSNGSKAVSDNVSGGGLKGTYPNGADLKYILDNGIIGDALPGVSTQSITAPNKKSSDFFNGGDNKSPAQTDSAFNSGQYIYIPYYDATDNIAKNSDNPTAVRYILKYKKESDGDTVTIESKHQ